MNIDVLKAEEWPTPQLKDAIHKFLLTDENEYLHLEVMFRRNDGEDDQGLK